MPSIPENAPDPKQEPTLSLLAAGQAYGKLNQVRDLLTQVQHLAEDESITSLVDAVRENQLQNLSLRAKLGYKPEKGPSIHGR